MSQDTQEVVKKRYLQQAQLLLHKAQKTAEKPRANVEPFSRSLSLKSTSLKEDGNIKYPQRDSVKYSRTESSNITSTTPHESVFRRTGIQSASAMARRDNYMPYQSKVEASRTEVEPSLNSDYPVKEFTFDDPNHSSPRRQSQPLVYDSAHPISSTPIAKQTQNISSVCPSSIDEDVLQVVCHSCSALEQKVKFLTEVNRELKRLLVASLGSDLKLRIEQLVHEKACISCDLDRSLCQLTDNMEEVDRVLIDCDIWRSKFLASRLMIDELASLKAELSLHLAESQRALQCILEERSELSDMLNECNIKLRKVVNQRYMPSSQSVGEHTHRVVGKSFVSLSSSKSLSSTRGTVLDVAQGTRSLVELLSDYSQWDGPRLDSSPPSVHTKKYHTTSTVTVQPTKGEQMAKQVLQTLTSKEKALPLPLKLRDLELSRLHVNRRNSPNSGLWLLEQQSSDISLHCSGCRGPAFYV